MKTIKFNEIHNLEKGRDTTDSSLQNLTLSYINEATVVRVIFDIGTKQTFTQEANEYPIKQTVTFKAVRCDH